MKISFLARLHTEKMWTQRVLLSGGILMLSTIRTSKPKSQLKVEEVEESLQSDSDNDNYY